MMSTKRQDYIVRSVWISMQINHHFIDLHCVQQKNLPLQVLYKICAEVIDSDWNSG